MKIKILLIALTLLFVSGDLLFGQEVEKKRPSSSLKAEHIRLVGGFTGLAIQEPPNGYTLSGNPLQGNFYTAAAYSLGVLYEFQNAVFYGTTTYTSIYENGDLLFDAGRFNYLKTSAGVGYRARLFFIGLGMTSVTDFERKKNRLGINISGGIFYPVGDKIEIGLLASTDFTSFMRQIVTGSIVVSYDLPLKP